MIGPGFLAVEGLVTEKVYIDLPAHGVPEVLTHLNSRNDEEITIGGKPEPVPHWGPVNSALYPASCRG